MFTAVRILHVPFTARASDVLRVLARVAPESPAPESLAPAVDGALNPTGTFYGVYASADDAGAVVAGGQRKGADGRRVKTYMHVREVVVAPAAADVAAAETQTYADVVGGRAGRMLAFRALPPPMAVPAFVAGLVAPFALDACTDHPLGPIFALPDAYRGGGDAVFAVMATEADARNARRALANAPVGLHGGTPNHALYVDIVG